MAMQKPSPLFLAIILGILGSIGGGLIGMFGYLGVDGLLHQPSGTGVEGEFAFPYGFAGSVLGLIGGVWIGFRLGRTR